MKLAVENGITSLILRVFIQDSSSTTGAGKTGLSHTSTGMIIALIADNEATATLYTVAASNVETITTLGTFAAPTSNKCRFKEVDSTNLPGVYELHFANTRWAVSGARSVQGMITGASGAVACPFEVQLADVPANVTKFGGTAATMAAGVPEVKIQSIANNAITAASIADGAIDTATFAAGATLSRVTLVDTCSVNSDMRGTDNAALAATALSTAVWTSTIAGRIDVTLSTLATAANQTKTLDRLGYLMAQEIGACADAGTSAESYTITIDTTTYTIDHTGLDATGNRGTATLTKS